jgi:hypothetical protein
MSVFKFFKRWEPILKLLKRVHPFLLKNQDLKNETKRNETKQNERKIKGQEPKKNETKKFEKRKEKKMFFKPCKKLNRLSIENRLRLQKSVTRNVVLDVRCCVLTLISVDF